MFHPFHNMEIDDVHTPWNPGKGKNKVYSEGHLQNTELFVIQRKVRTSGPQSWYPVKMTLL